MAPATGNNVARCTGQRATLLLKCVPTWHVECQTWHVLISRCPTWHVKLSTWHVAFCNSHFSVWNSAKRGTFGGRRGPSEPDFPICINRRLHHLLRIEEKKKN